MITIIDTESSYITTQNPRGVLRRDDSDISNYIEDEDDGGDEPAGPGFYLESDLMEKICTEFATWALLKRLNNQSHFLVDEKSNYQYELDYVFAVNEVEYEHDEKPNYRKIPEIKDEIPETLLDDNPTPADNIQSNAPSPFSKKRFKRDLTYIPLYQMWRLARAA